MANGTGDKKIITNDDGIIWDETDIVWDDDTTSTEGEKGFMEQFVGGVFENQIEADRLDTELKTLTENETVLKGDIKDNRWKMADIRDEVNNTVMDEAAQSLAVAEFKRIELLTIDMEKSRREQIKTINELEIERGKYAAPKKMAPEELVAADEVSRIDDEIRYITEEATRVKEYINTNQ